MQTEDRSMRKNGLTNSPFVKVVHGRSEEGKAMHCRIDASVRTCEDDRRKKTRLTSNSSSGKIKSLKCSVFKKPLAEIKAELMTTSDEHRICCGGASSN